MGQDVYIQSILPTYLNFMEDKTMFPKENKITFMQDGAPAHYGGRTRQVCNIAVHFVLDYVKFRLCETKKGAPLLFT